MKKLLLSTVAIAMLSTTLSADFLRIEGAIGAMQTDSKGSLYLSGENINLNDSTNYDKDTNPYAWIRVKHPIPLLPNFKFEYAKINNDGSSVTPLTLGGNTYAINSSNSLELTEIDGILYYNLLDDTVGFTLDLGIDFKYLESSFNVSGAGNTYEESVKGIVPLAYTRVRYDIPLTNIGLDVEGKYIKYKDNSISDFSAKVDYTFDITPVIQPIVEVGYRYKKYEFEHDNDSLDLKFSGFFAGIGFKF